MMVRKSKLIGIVTASVLTIGAVGYVTDAAIATRAEAKLSNQIKEYAQLDVTPRVSINTGPLYSTAHITGEIGSIQVHITDVETPKFGLVNTHTVAMGVTGIPTEDPDATAKLLSRTVALDAVSLGSLLNIADLNISNPYNISPAGVREPEVELRGTPAGHNETVAVRADLRLDGSKFRLTPTEALDGPDDALNAFALDFDTRTLPIGAQASYVYVQGGTIVFEAQKRNDTLSISDFSPRQTSQTTSE